MFESQFAVRRAHLFSTFLIAALLSAACATSERHELAARDIHAALDARAGGPFASMDAEQLAGLEALSLSRPSAEECSDPSTAGYWRACALAWNPAVRAARRELQRTLANAGVAGQPDRIEAALEAMDFSDLERETKLAATVDLLGILGLGPSKLAREVARAEVVRSRSAFESAVWSAIFDVERARLRLAASRDREVHLNALWKQVAVHSERFEILERRGRLSEADAEMARAAFHEIEHELSKEQSREVELRAELARVSGMPFDHAAFDSIAAGVLSEPRQVPRATEARELLEQDPALRERSIEYAQAELQVRRVAADAWPTLRAGPMLTLNPSDLLLGGVLDVSLPWPGKVEKEIRVASAEREAARERLEDALNSAMARVASLRVIEHEARARATEHAVMLDDAQEASWQSVNARLRLGMATAMEWSRALRERIAPMLALVEEREGAAIAALDLAQACGVEPRQAEVLP
jgi:outer membrane protein TolC